MVFKNRMYCTCGITVKLDRSCCKPIVEISTPSIVILPFEDSIIRKSESNKDDLPAPVRPIMPT